MKWLRTSNIDWVRFGWIVGGIAVMWGALILVIPPDLFKWVSSILAAISVGLAYFTRSGKWVDTRNDQPPQ